MYIYISNLRVLANRTCVAPSRGAGAASVNRYCDPKGRRALLRVPSTVGRSVCLCWAPSKLEGPEGAGTASVSVSNNGGADHNVGTVFFEESVAGAVRSMTPTVGSVGVGTREAERDLRVLEGLKTQHTLGPLAWSWGHWSTGRGNCSSVQMSVAHEGGLM